MIWLKLLLDNDKIAFGSVVLRSECITQRMESTWNYCPRVYLEATGCCIFLKLSKTWVQATLWVESHVAPLEGTIWDGSSLPLYSSPAMTHESLKGGTEVTHMDWKPCYMVVCSKDKETNKIASPASYFSGASCIWGRLLVWEERTHRIQPCVNKLN